MWRNRYIETFACVKGTSSWPTSIPPRRTIGVESTPGVKTHISASSNKLPTDQLHPVPRTDPMYSSECASLAQLSSAVEVPLVRLADKRSLRPCRPLLLHRKRDTGVHCDTRDQQRQGYTPKRVAVEQAGTTERNPRNYRRRLGLQLCTGTGPHCPSRRRRCGRRTRVVA